MEKVGYVWDINIWKPGQRGDTYTQRQQQSNDGTSFLPDNDRQPMDRTHGEIVVAR